MNTDRVNKSRTLDINNHFEALVGQIKLEIAEISEN